MDWQVEVFVDGEWHPLWGTDTDGRCETSISPEEYVRRVSKLTPLPLRVKLEGEEK